MDKFIFSRVSKNSLNFVYVQSKYLLVYNNWNRKLKYPVEYINYMNGEIKNVETIEQLQK